MKIFSQFAIILAICFAAKLLDYLTGGIIPESVSGIIILFILLSSRALKFEKIESLSRFFLDNLVFFLIPAIAGAGAVVSAAEGYLFQLLFLIAVAAVIVMAVTALCSSMLITAFKLNGKKGMSE